MQKLNSNSVDLLGAEVHWVDFGGPPDPEAILVCVHGLGGATVNWSAWAPLMTERFRVVALDLAGFGYTEPGQRSASLAANTELVDSFVTFVRNALAVPATPLVLVGNSMGGLLAARATSGRSDVAGLVLLDPALPHAGRVPTASEFAGLALYAIPAVGRAIARGRRRLRSPEQLVDDTFRLCLNDPSVVSGEVTERHVVLARHRVERSDLDPLFEQAARHTVLAMANSDLRSIYASVRVPVLLVHGTEDRLVPYSAAVAMWRACPAWSFLTAAGGGHIPMLERPTWLARVTQEWLSRSVAAQGSVA